MKRKLVAALACRNQGSRLYGKPLQNLDVEKGIRIIDNIIDGLNTLDCIDSIVLGISEGEDNEVFKTIAEQKGIEYIVGDQIDVLHRLIKCAEKVDGTDVFRVTSESPFLHHKAVNQVWDQHCSQNNDATFYDDIIDGCGFEIIQLSALKESHERGESKHRSELCSLYIRENKSDFKINQVTAPPALYRKDLRLTVDNPEDLVICRAIYKNFKSNAPQIQLEDIITFLDKHPHLIELTYPFTEEGYKSMYL